MSIRPDGTGLKIALILENEVRRYGVEGMLGRLDCVSSVTCFSTRGEAVTSSEAPTFDLVVMSAAELSDTEHLPAVERPRVSNTRLLLLVDGSDGAGMPEVTPACVHSLADWSGLTPRVFADAISDMMAGKFYVSATLARRVLKQVGRPSVEAQPWGPQGAMLTPRELQVLHLVAEGLSNKQAARRLQISEHGVKRLVGNVLAKLNCPNRTLAVVRAMEDGLLVDVNREPGREVGTPQSATSVA